MIPITLPCAVMISRAILSLLLVVLLGASATAIAGDGRYDMAPDERREMRQQMRDHWQRDRVQRGDGERRWRSMEPDERQRLRDDMREHRGRRDDRGERRGGRRD